MVSDWMREGVQDDAPFKPPEPGPSPGEKVTRDVQFTVALLMLGCGPTEHW
ncbi:hypothetical protein [Hydrogenophaga sp. ZJX-1]|uniref:hypothetical protein n=1 Tax=Hydrogenophaga sp. ZJX-1 TaxID=3404778 RepID=UPI003B282C87